MDTFSSHSEFSLIYAWGKSSATIFYCIDKTWVNPSLCTEDNHGTVLEFINVQITLLPLNESNVFFCHYLSFRGSYLIPAIVQLNSVKSKLLTKPSLVSLQIWQFCCFTILQVRVQYWYCCFIEFLLWRFIEFSVL